MDTTQPSMFGPLIIFAGFFIFMYFLMIRPQNKRNKALAEMLSKVERGSEVIAASGILGKVTDVKGDYVSIEVGQNITLRLQKSAISNILPKGTIDSIN